MCYNQCHAAKDFQRKVQLSIDELVYAGSLRKISESVFVTFSRDIKPILSLSLELSEFILKYSVYEPLIRLAQETKNEIRAQIDAINHAKDHCSNVISKKEQLESYISASCRIRERMIEDMKMTEISERLGCDYLKYMICLIEGAVRLTESALVDEECSAAIPVLRANSRKGRELLRAMGKLLALTS